METLYDAAAHVVKVANDAGKLTKLGKTKLFKTLYLADWYYYLNTTETIFDIKWYRIEKGPGLKSSVWNSLCKYLLDKYEINPQWVRRFYPQVYFEVGKEIKTDIPPQIEEYINIALNDVIDITAPEAAKFTYETEPMRWLIAQEREIGGIPQYREFRIDDPERIKFKELTEQYINGEIDIPDISREMGEDWPSSRVVLYLDLIETYRQKTNIFLSEKQEQEILTYLLDYSFKDKPKTCFDTKSIEDEVIASQRIEGIYISPDTFEDDF